MNALLFFFAMLNREKSQEYRARLLQYLDQKRSEVKIVDNGRFSERGGVIH